MFASALEAVAALADPSRRRDAAQAVATYVGAEDLVVFVRDGEIDSYLPGVGFPKTFPRGRAWQDFVKRCAATADILDAELPYPDGGSIRRARGFACQADSVLVLLGGSPRAELVDELRAGIPLLARIFQVERAIVAHEGHAAFARSVAERAEALAASLAASQSELHRVLRRLHDSEQRFSTTLSSIADAVIATDLSGRVAFMNAVAESLTGWEMADARSRPLSDIFDVFDEASRGSVEDPVAKVLRDGKIVAFEKHTILVRRDGAEISIDHSAAPIHDARGALAGVVLVFRDNTARRRAEVERDEQHRLAELGWHVGAALASKAPIDAQLRLCTDAVVEHVGAAFARIWILNHRDQILELRASSGMYTRLDGGHARVPIGAFKIGLIGEQQAPHLTNDVQRDPRVSDQDWAKREGMVAFAGYPLVVDGSLVGVIALFARRPLSEVTLHALASIADQLAVAIDRAAAETSLRASELRYQLATRATREAVWDWDLTSNKLTWNEGVQDLFGFSIGEVGPAATWRFKMIHPEDRDRVVHGLHHVIDSGGTSWQEEYRYRRGDGSYALVLDRGYVARDASGKPLQMVGAMQDVSELKKREDELSNALRVNEMFVGILGHDLRNPLGAVLAGAELLEQQLADERQLRTVRRIGSAGDRMTDMIDQLLDLTRVRLAGGLGIVRTSKRLDVSNLVQRTVEELRGANPERELVVETRGDGATSGDAGRLLQLFSNLVANALHHGTPATPVSITVDGRDREIVVRVHNGGVIPADLLPTIFNPFRGRQRTSSKSRGLGLGLFIAQQIVIAHGGRLDVESTETAGTTFAAHIPRSSARSKQAGADGIPKIVLIVDDDQDIRESLREAFEEEGYKAVTASNGQDALELLGQATPRPDVVILDLVMPVMDGGRLYQAMQADVLLATIPVIVSTSNAARAPRGVVVVPKPLKLDRLLDTVADLWRESRPG